MKVALCLIACLHVVVVVGMASGRHQPLQHHSPVALHDRRLNSKLNIETLRIPGSRHPPPRQPDVRGNDFLRMRGGSHNAWKGNVHVCDICPASEAIAPCTCQCLNETAAELICGPELLTCSQLTEVMCLSAYPVNPYHRLVVQNTDLGCKLEKNLWGPLMFKEIVITNNHFQALDNLAFQPFSATLMALDLGGNSLKDVYFSTMNDTPLLRFLSLRNNNIEFLPGYMAMELALLEVFDASYNKITAIYPKTFIGMPKLQMINLSNNAISKVSAGAFTIMQHSATKLYINLAHNLISSIEPGMMEEVRVSGINLQDNRLTLLSEKVFRPIIDFTAASAVFWTLSNPLDCDSQFCWIATNATVSSTFGTVLCPNLGNEPVEVLEPSCSALTTTPPTRRLRTLQARFNPLLSTKKRKSRPAATKLRDSPRS